MCYLVYSSPGKRWKEVEEVEAGRHLGEKSVIQESHKDQELEASEIMRG